MLAGFPTFTQIGPDINGEAARDEFGHSVSMSADGSTFVVGAPGNDGGGSTAGHVRVYKFNSSIKSYTQFGLDIDGKAPADFFGVSVDISADGTTIVVGAPSINSAGGASGYVRVYKFDSSVSSYVQFGSDINAEAGRDGFGTSVSMSADGTTFAVGAPFNDGNGNSAGHIRVFKFEPSTNTYVQVGVDIDGEAEFDLFGHSVSMSADGLTFVVGAPANDGGGIRAGHVRVYTFNSSIKLYAQLGSDINGEAADDEFGRSVSMSADGTTFVVGAILNDCGEINAGHVRVYKFSSQTSSYEKIGLDIDGEAPEDQFGSSVSMSADGSIFVVGAIFNDSTAVSNIGHVRVYNFSSTTNTYAQVGVDIVGEAANDQFGSSLSLSADGTIVAIGAPLNDGAGSNAGHVRVFKLNLFDTTAPTAAPVSADSPDCGLFRLKFFCPRSGNCGFFSRLFNINGCLR